MSKDIINSIKADLGHDKIVLEQIKEEIRQLELKLRYYEGKYDGRNEAFEIVEKTE